MALDAARRTFADAKLPYLVHARTDAESLISCQLSSLLENVFSGILLVEGRQLPLGVRPGHRFVGDGVTRNSGFSFTDRTYNVDCVQHANSLRRTQAVEEEPESLPQAAMKAVSLHALK